MSFEPNEIKAVERLVVVGNRMGLHSRPAAVIAKMLADLDAELHLCREVGELEDADCRSVLSLLVLAASNGTRLRLRGTGPDAEIAVERIGKFFDRNFDEE